MIASLTAGEHRQTNNKARLEKRKKISVNPYLVAQREENEAWRFIYLNINLTCGKFLLRLLPGKPLHPPTSGKAVLQDR